MCDTASCRHQLAQSAALCVDGATSRSTVETQNTQWLGLPRRCRESLEQSTAIDNVVAPVQKGTEEGIVPTFIVAVLTLAAGH